MAYDPNSERTGLTGLFRAVDMPDITAYDPNESPVGDDGVEYTPGITYNLEYEEDNEHTGIMNMDELPKRETMWDEFLAEIRAHRMRVWWILCAGVTVFGAVFALNNQEKDQNVIRFVTPTSSRPVPSATHTNRPVIPAPVPTRERVRPSVRPSSPAVASPRPTMTRQRPTTSPRPSQSVSPRPTTTRTPTPRPTTVKPTTTPTSTPTPKVTNTP